MNPEKSLSPVNFSERFIELFNETLVSPNPTLNPASAQKIAEIRTNRMAQLFGEERFQAASFFDCLDGVSPLEALKLEHLFQPLADSDCSNEAILEVTERVLNPLTRSARDINPPDLERNEWGYLSGKARVKSINQAPQEVQEPSAQADVFPKFLPVSVDETKSIREGDAVLMGLYRHLLAVDDNSVRQSLAQDCLAILQLRTDIFLPIDEPPLKM